MVDVWGAQAVVANNTEPFTQAEFLDEIQNILDDARSGMSETLVTTACMITVLRYANGIGVNIDEEVSNAIRSAVTNEWKKRTR